MTASHISVLMRSRTVRAFERAKVSEERMEAGFSGCTVSQAGTLEASARSKCCRNEASESVMVSSGAHCSATMPRPDGANGASAIA